MTITKQADAVPREAGTAAGAGPGSRPLPRARRGTWTFLHGGGARKVRHVHLATEVDASAMVAAREASGGTVGYTALVVHAAARVATGFSLARTVLRNTLFGPRLVESDDVVVKLPVDRTVNGVRCVLPCLVPSAQTLSVAEIQRILDTHRDAPVDSTGPYAAVLRLQRLPLLLYRLVYGLAMARTSTRVGIQGTFSVTSVGQHDVSLIHPLISGTYGLGMGRVRPAPVVRDQRVVVVPQFSLTLAFDHRVVDGAEAASLLTAIKTQLEGGSVDGHDLG